MRFGGKRSGGAAGVTAINEPFELVIEPVERTSLLDVLATWEPLDLDTPELTDEKPDAIEL